MNLSTEPVNIIGQLDCLTKSGIRRPKKLMPKGRPQTYHITLLVNERSASTKRTAINIEQALAQFFKEHHVPATVRSVKVRLPKVEKDAIHSQKRDALLCPNSAIGV